MVVVFSLVNGNIAITQPMREIINEMFGQEVALSIQRRDEGLVSKAV